MAEDMDLTPWSHGKSQPACERVTVHGIDGQAWFWCVPQVDLL